MGIYILMTLIVIFFSFIYSLNTNTEQVSVRKRLVSIIIEKSTLLVVILALALPGVFRYNIGTDYMLYHVEYLSYEITGDSRHDFGFRLLERITQQTGLGYQGLIAISFFIFIVGFISLSIYISQDLVIAGLLLLFTYNYFIAYSLIAQYTAVGFVCLFLRELLKDKYVLSSLYLFMAGSMHSSAYVFIVVFVLYFMLKRYKTIKINIVPLSIFVLAVIPIIGQSLLIAIIERTRFAGYTYDQTYMSLTSFSFVVINICVAIYMTSVFLLKPTLKSNLALDVFYVVQLIATVLTFMQGQITLIFRLIYYFSFFQIISLPLFTNLFFQKKISRYINVVILLFYLIWFIKYPYMGDYYSTFPYKSIFEG